MSDDERYFHVCRVVYCSRESLRISFTNAQVEIEFPLQYLELHQLLPIGPGDGLYIKGITGNGDNDIRTVRNIERIRIKYNLIHFVPHPQLKRGFRDTITRIFVTIFRLTPNR